MTYADILLLIAGLALLAYVWRPMRERREWRSEGRTGYGSKAGFWR